MTKYGVLFFLLSPGIIFAQEGRAINDPGKFYFINQLGLLNGQAGYAYQLQTINGFHHKSWFGGVGVGLDNYRFRGIPLFIDGRKEFGKRGNSFFLYADCGIHFCWLTGKEKSSFSNGTLKNSLNGLYTNAGIGYKIRITKRNSLLINAGYSFKNVRATVLQPSPVDGFLNIVKYNYKLNRLDFKVGWAF